MTFTADEMTTRFARVLRVAGAGLGGAVTGALVAWIWAVGAAAASEGATACQSANGDGSFCLGIGPAAAAVAGSVTVISAATLFTVALLRVRPKRLTVPLGCIVIAIAVFFTGFGFPGGRGPASWAAAVAAGAGLAAVALSVDRGRAQLAGWAGIAIVVLGSLLVPRTVARHEQANAQAATLARLGFALELPSVPGYYPMGGYASPGGSLEISMGADGAAPARALAFTVALTRADSSDGVFDLSLCHQRDPELTPQLACRAEGPGRWLITESGSPDDGALAEKGGMVIVVQPTGTADGAPLPDDVVLEAVSSLRPASASAIAALG